MATAGTISVNLIARTEAFVKGMKRSQRNVRALGKATAATMRTVRLLGLAAATAAVGGLTLLTKRSLENIDVIAKLSDRLGVSTEFLSAFGHAAKIAGSSQETFFKGIQYMLKNIGEANMGLKSYQDSFDVLGLNYERLEKMAPEEAFMKIAKALNAVQDKTTQVSAAMRIFGRSGSELLNLMAGDLDGVIDRAQKLGIAFSREMAARVEEANDAITRMKAGFAGVGNTIAIAVAPYIEGIADSITKATAGQAGLAEMQKRMEKIAIAGTYILDAFNGIRMVVNSIAAFWQKIFSLVFRSIERLNTLAEKVTRKLRFLPGMKGLSSFYGNVGSVAKELREDFSAAASKNWGQAKDQFAGMGKRREQLKQFFKSVAAESTTAAVGTARSAAEAVAETLDTQKIEKQYGGQAEVFNASMLNLAGLRNRREEDRTEELLEEMLIIQRKAFVA